MKRAILLAALGLAICTAGTAAQDIPSGASGSGFSGGNAPRTIPQQFSSRLKLDARTQGPAVDQILNEAGAEAAPIAQRLLQLRQAMLNAAIQKRAEDQQAAEAAYAEAAAQLAGVEARAFAKVYALLRPNQQRDAPQAFALLAGLFNTPPPAGRGGRGGRGGE